MSDKKNPAVSKAPPPITPLRHTYKSPKQIDENLPDWNFWKHKTKWKLWESVCLACNCNPDKENYNDRYNFSEHGIGSNTKFKMLLRLLRDRVCNSQWREFFSDVVRVPNADFISVRPSEFAAWCLHIGYDIPPELAALAGDAPQAAAAKMKAVPAEQPTSLDYHDEKLARLFEPVPVEALEKMFPASGKWQSWADKAKNNGLIDAREAPARFNPYKAGVWFVNKGITGWDTARLNRTLANNLPARSHDDAYLLTGGID